MFALRYRLTGFQSGACFTLTKSVILTGAVIALAVSCGGQGGTQEITETRTVAPSAGPGTAPVGQQMAMNMPAPSSGYSWQTPEGWIVQPATSTRIANFRVDRDSDAECYLTVLGGMGGGVEANINRWRDQLSLEPYTPAEMAELPTLNMLGKDALLVECEGTFKGMSGGVVRKGYKLLGVILEDEGSAVFVKMTGPTEVVDREKDNFKAFCQSLEHDVSAQTIASLPEGHPSVGPMGATSGVQPGTDLPEGHPDIGNMSPMAGAAGMTGSSAPAIHAWTAPDGWTQGPAKPMRAVTFTMGAGGQTECYITSLSGPAGGVDANINRWRQQMGQPPLDAEAMKALPQVTILGQPSPMVEIQGTFSGMDGQGGGDYALLGAIRTLEGSTLFVKMTGPAAEVQAEKDNFVAFCESLQ